MTIGFWALAGLIVYAYVGYPVLITLVSFLGRRGRRVDPSFEPHLTILIPAYNEEAVIAAKLENTLRLDYPAAKLQVVVASESDDGTDTIVSRYADRGVVLLPSTVRRGKVANLGRAVPESTGEILIFTDANAMFRPDALRKIVRHFADPRVGSVSGRLVYLNPSKAASASGEGAYWGFEYMVKRASSRLGSLPGANGSIFGLRRELYRPISERRGDDFELPIRAIIAGKESILEPEAVSEEEAAGRYRDEYRRKVRIINWMFTSAVILIREALARGRLLIAFQLLSHKVNRWLVPFWLLGLAPLSLLLMDQGDVYRATAAAQGLLYLAALLGGLAGLLGLRLPGLLMLPAYFVMVNTASLVGVVTALTGHEVSWHKRTDPDT